MDESSNRERRTGERYLHKPSLPAPKAGARLAPEAERQPAVQGAAANGADADRARGSGAGPEPHHVRERGPALTKLKLGFKVLADVQKWPSTLEACDRLDADPALSDADRALVAQMRQAMTQRASGVTLK